MGLFKTEGTILDKNFRREHPGWPKQLLLFTAILLAIMVGVDVVGNYIERDVIGSEQSRRIKEVLSPIAEQLETAERVGDRATALHLMGQATRIINAYNNLGDTNSPLRYCLLAAVNLADGTQEVLNTGYWSSKDKYQNSLDMCK